MDPFFGYLQGGFQKPMPMPAAQGPGAQRQMPMPQVAPPAQPPVQTMPQRPQQGANPLADMFAQTEQQYGLPQGYLYRTAQIESSLNPQAKNPRSSASGLFQFIDSTARQYGLENPFDPRASTDAAARLARDNAAILRKTLGRDPTAAELYLAHQQGGGGAAKLLSNPNARAVDVVGAEAVRLNGGNVNMTAGEFANLWISKHGGGRDPVISTSGRAPQQQAQIGFQPRYTKFDFELEGKRRPNPPAPQLLNALDVAAASAFGPGSRVVIYSGQEDAGNQHGSNRHRTGLAADMRVYDPQGQLVKLNDPRAATFMRAAARAGVKGLGAGSEYMGDAFHFDAVPHENYTGGQDMAWGSMGNAMQPELQRLVNARPLGPQQPQAPGMRDTVMGQQGADMIGMQGQAQIAGGNSFPQVNLPELPPQYRPRRSSREIMGFLSQHGKSLNETQRAFAMQQLQLAQKFEDPWGQLELRKQYADAIGWKPQTDPLGNFLTDEQEQRLGLDTRGVYAMDGSKVQVVQPPPEMKPQELPAGVREAMWYAQQLNLQPGTPEYNEFIRRQAQGGGTALQVGPDGTISFTQGGAQLPKLTEAQSKDVGYVNRMQGALPTLDMLDQELTSLGNRALNWDFTGALRGRMQDPNFQLAQQAGEEFLQALLRKDTGAAITAQEQDLYGKTYLPQPGDGPEVIAQKKAARQRALDGVRMGLGPVEIVMQERQTVANPPVPGAPDAGAGQGAASPAQPQRPAAETGKLPDSFLRTLPPGEDAESLWEFMSEEDRAIFQ